MQPDDFITGLEARGYTITTKEFPWGIEQKAINKSLAYRNLWHLVRYVSDREEQMRARLSFWAPWLRAMTTFECPTPEGVERIDKWRNREDYEKTTSYS